MGFKDVFVYLLLAAAPLTQAHPAHGESRPIPRSYPNRRSLGHCQKRFDHPDFERRTIERRVEELKQYKRELGIADKPALRPRQFFGGGGGINREAVTKVLETDHKLDADISAEDSAAKIFADSGSCVLTPEVTEGPLYVRGEQIRQDVTEGEGGVKMRINIQVVDVETCEPVTDAWVDFWGCNSTGVYGGVLDYPGNGDPNDLSLINVTTLRGIQPTDKDGIASFDAVVPGHYAGRANHVHALVHHDVTQLENGTITGGRVSHVGQIYFDQSLLQIVEKTEPYATNTQTWTQNQVDALFMMGTANGDDPVIRYVMLSEDITDGIYAYIRFGVDLTAQRRFSPAAYKDESGGHQMPAGQGFGAGFGGGGFGGGGFGGGGFGGGAFPGAPGAAPP